MHLVYLSDSSNRLTPAFIENILLAFILVDFEGCGGFVGFPVLNCLGAFPLQLVRFFCFCKQSAANPHKPVGGDLWYSDGPVFSQEQCFSLG
jgi:hypothetical protein